MPNIFKAFSRAKAEPYRFPNADEIVVPGVEPEPEAEAEPETGPDDGEEFIPLGDGPSDGEDEEAGSGAALSGGEETDKAKPAKETKETPVSFAQVQAEQILADARKEADNILLKARDKADAETKKIFTKAREEGYQEGYVAGMAQAAQESIQAREEQAVRLEEEVHRFMEHAGVALDRQMDQSVDDLRDLAMAVAEKVISVSLKSSADVIARMIQTAIDKRKKKEWVHIYIAECDAKRLTQLPASLTKALSGLSDRVRIIPMADDESGTCIIEMPDEIIDASVSTQLSNLRTILNDTANSGSGNYFF